MFIDHFANSLYPSFLSPVSFTRSRWKHEHSVSWYSGKYERNVILYILLPFREKKKVQLLVAHVFELGFIMILFGY